MSSFCGDDVDWRLLFLFVKPKCRLVWCKRRWNWPRAWPVSPLINNRMSLSLSSSLTIHRLWLFDYLTIGLFDYLTILCEMDAKERRLAPITKPICQKKRQGNLFKVDRLRTHFGHFLVLFGSLRRLSSIWWLCSTVFDCGCATSARRRIIITRSLSLLSRLRHITFNILLAVDSGRVALLSDMYPLQMRTFLSFLRSSDVLGQVIFVFVSRPSISRHGVTDC